MAKRYDTAYKYWLDWEDVGKQEENLKDPTAMERLVNKIVADAQSFIEDTKGQREQALSLDAVDAEYLKSCETAEVYNAYQRVIAECADEQDTIKQAALSSYLSFRQGKPFERAFGAFETDVTGTTAAGRYKRLDLKSSLPNRAPIGYMLDVLMIHSKDLYVDVWSRIAELIETAVAPDSEQEPEVAITKERYQKEIRVHDKDSAHMFDAALNRQAYGENSSVSYRVKLKDSRGYETHTLVLSYANMEREGLVQDGRLTELFYEVCGLNQFDRAVCGAICTIYDKRSIPDSEYTVIPLNEIAVLVFPKGDITKERIEDVKQSCEKMRRTFVKITFGSQSNKMGSSYLDGFLLPYYGRDVYVKEFGSRIDAIALSAPPIMLKLGERCSLISRPKLPTGKTAKEIQSSLPNYTKSFVALREYVRQRVELIDRLAQAEWKRQIKENKKLGIETPTVNEVYSEDQRLLKTADIYNAMNARTQQQKKTVRTNTKTVLQELVDRKQIQGWQEVKVGKTIKGYEIMCITKK